MRHNTSIVVASWYSRRVALHHVVGITLVPMLKIMLNLIFIGTTHYLSVMQEVARVTSNTNISISVITKTVRKSVRCCHLKRCVGNQSFASLLINHG